MNRYMLSSVAVWVWITALTGGGIFVVNNSLADVQGKRIPQQSVKESKGMKQKREKKQIHIDPLSIRSLLLIIRNQGAFLGTATGFVVQKENVEFLITNWHVVTGKDPDTGKPLKELGGKEPDEIAIFHNSSTRLGSRVTKVEKLYENKKPRWLEHPQGKSVDVVALPLQEIDSEVKVYPLDLRLADTDMIPEPAMPVSIIGYPSGQGSAGPGRGFPIWKTGHIASDPDLDYAGRPVFLVDATTRGGMSGSPVVLKLIGGFRQSSGDVTLVRGEPLTKFLGVYSGRVGSSDKESLEIGMIWKPHLIEEILDSR